MIKYKESLVFKITVGTATVMTILFLILITSNLYSLHVVRSNTINSAENEMRIYINNMNNCLDNAVNDLNEISLNLYDLGDLKNSNESSRYFSSWRLQDKLTERITISKTTDTLAIYNETYDTLLLSSSRRVSSKEKTATADIIKAKLANSKKSYNDLWAPIEINDKMFFYKISRFSDNIIVAFIKADTLMSFINLKDNNTDEQLILTDNEGKPLAKVGNTSFSDIQFPLANKTTVISNFAKQYMMITINFDTSYARLSTIIKEKSILVGLGYIQWIIAILGIISLFLMPFIIFYLNKEIIKPIKGLVVGTQKIEQGNLDYNVPSNGSSLEFKTLTSSFNSMVKEIKTLKISAYEEKIELQKAELKYLQMQIRPHFFLNALTTIHSLSYKDKNEEIRKFIDALSSHLRYMFKGGLIKVSIKEEIEYIKNYFYMQEIKFPNSVFYVFDVEPSIELERIPQFLIHTFVENAFKHAMTLEDTLSMFIKIESYVLDKEEAVKITIEDNGEGFPKEVLDRVNNIRNKDISDGYKIGITNIKRTLELLYKKDNLLKISNVDSMGGRVEIIIPIEKGDENEVNNSRG